MSTPDDIRSDSAIERAYEQLRRDGLEYCDHCLLWKPVEDSTPIEGVGNACKKCVDDHYPYCGECEKHVDVERQLVCGEIERHCAECDVPIE